MWIVAVSHERVYLQQTRQALVAGRFERRDLSYDLFADKLKNEFAKRARWLALKNLVDVYIPFLPMTSAEVEQAVVRQLQV